MNVGMSVGRRVAWMVVVAAVFVASHATGPVSDAAAAPSAPTATMDSSELALLRSLNQERIRRGLAPMAHDTSMASTSRDWSRHMAAIGKLLHDPNLLAVVNALGVTWKSAGENVGYGGSAGHLHDMFLASPVHRANMLSSDFNRVGIGTVQSGSRLWVTVRFLDGPPIGTTTGLGICAGTLSGSDGVTTGDLRGDGYDDVVINCPGTAEDRVLMGVADGVFRWRRISIRGANVPIAGDFDGDGTTNVLFYGPGSAADHLSTWSGGRFVSTPISVAGNYEPRSGDFDGDGLDDILWYTPGPGPDRIWYGTRTLGRFVNRRLTVNGVFDPVVTDLDGDGRDDIFWYGPGAAHDQVHYSLGRWRHRSVRVEVGGRYRPVAGDFNGAGGGDIFWYAPGSAADHVWYGRTRRGSYDKLRMTVNGRYRPVTGDFDGDGRTDVMWMASGAAGTPLWHGTGTRGRFRMSRVAVS